MDPTSTTLTTTLTTPPLTTMLNVTTASLFSDYPDYGDQIPLDFMDVNKEFAIALMTCLAGAGAVGTFGNLLILVSVATQKELQNVESVFVVNLAICDLVITTMAQPLSVVAKTVGWRFFEGLPWLCRIIGYFCTISCVGSLMTLSAMSCNRYVLIVHHAHYRRLFTLRNCLLIVLGIYSLGFLLILPNWFGLGDHYFDYKSYECVWDRMASHDYTIFFSIVLVWIPIVVVGFTYGRMYHFVKKSRENLNKHPNTTTSSNNTLRPPRPTGRMQLIELMESSAVRRGDVTNETVTEDTEDNDVKSGDDVKGVDDVKNEHGVKNEHDDHGKGDKAGSGGVYIGPEGDDSGYEAGGDSPAARNGNAEQRADATTPNKGKTPNSKSVRFYAVRKPTAILPGLKLARPLFIIYVVFTTCWLPYSLTVIIDRYDQFPHELHAFVTAFAHTNSSINWLVYYFTHSKLRRAFRKLLGLSRFYGNRVAPDTTSMTAKPKSSFR